MRMERLDPQIIENAILDAPGWARVGLTSPAEHQRRQSLRELALSIADHLEGRGQPADPAQLALSL